MFDGIIPSTSPDPTLIAALAARATEPGKFFEPPIIKVFPKEPLFEFSFLSGKSLKDGAEIDVVKIFTSNS